MPLPLVTEAEIFDFLRLYACSRYWCKADGRTREGQAQLAALSRGWIEPARTGLGYQFTDSENTPKPDVLQNTPNQAILQAIKEEME